MAGKGGKVQADNKPRTAGPGPFSQRTDLVAGKQPVQLPNGMPYGDRQMLEGAQQAVPLQSGGPIQPQAPGGAPGGAPQGPSMAPGDVADLLAHPTQNPDEPVTTGASTPPSNSLAMKVDVLRHLATLPYASPEITALLDAAMHEMTFTQQSAPVSPVTQ